VALQEQTAAGPTRTSLARVTANRDELVSTGTRSDRTVRATTSLVMVPAILLTLGGLAAGALAMWPLFGRATGHISAAALGAVLAAYLWIHAGIRDRVRLGAVVGAAVVADLVMALVGVAGLLITYMVSSANPTPFAATAAAGAVGAAVVAVVFLPVLPSKDDHLHLEITFCAAAGASSILLWEWGGGYVAMVATGPIAQVPYWHAAVAGSLAIVASLRLRPGATDRFALRSLAGGGAVAVCAMLMVSDDVTRALAPAPHRVIALSPYAESIRAAKIRSVEAAPPLADLRAVAPSAGERMFPRPLTGVGCYPVLEQSYPPDTKQIETVSLQLPAHHQYYLQCYRLEDGANGARVNVLILRYPNEAWARYELRHQRGYDRLFEQRYVARIRKDDRPIFVMGEKTYWVSGDKILAIGGSAPGETVGAFVDQYLRRFPNSLDPDFDLPYLPVMN